MANNLSSKLSSLLKTRASIFNTVYNPSNARTGSKILSSRLRGPSMLSYYPEQDLGKETLRLSRFYDELPNFGLVNLEEVARLEEVERRKRRGKGPPKKGGERRAGLGKKS